MTSTVRISSRKAYKDGTCRGQDTCMQYQRLTWIGDFPYYEKKKISDMYCTIDNSQYKNAKH